MSDDDIHARRTAKSTRYEDDFPVGELTASAEYSTFALRPTDLYNGPTIQSVTSKKCPELHLQILASF
ncbi:hypothetical protein CERZMDRAFT_91760 [Cercospora zeae-maydis SCOH1-5]|uniref:Uncharacterized protein n=1 Tax=Cercospora zeae-maydis SCOH1-5 TaxID=717836 RepID=A0A6A6F2S4_9PEZI|nr:hypothetical protein CERZMDRAFT_91760 [Cercospora zeae-maydis SCOH1-5]